MKDPRARIGRALLLLLELEVGWLVLANLFLNTAVGPWAINRRPEKWSLRWESARSYYPARVEIEGLVYRQTTRRIDVEVTADRVVTRVAVLPLLARRLVFDGVDAGRVGVEIHRRPPPEGSPPPPRKKGPGWLIALRGIRIDQAERFAFNRVELTGGSASAEGTFEIRVRGEMEVRDARLDWRGAQMRVEGEPVTESLDLAFAGGFSPFDPKVHRGFASLGFLSAAIDIEGRAGTLVPLGLLFSGVKWIEGIDGEGDVDAHLQVVDGHLQPGSELAVEATGLELDLLGFRARGAGTVDASVDRNRGVRAGLARVAFDSFDFERRGFENVLAEGSGLTLTVSAEDLAVVSGLSGVEVVLDLPRSSSPDVSFLSRYLPAGLGLAVEGGQAALAAHLEVPGDGGGASGSFDLQGRELAGTFRNMGFRASLDLGARLSGGKLDDFELELEGTELRIFDTVFESDGVAVQDGWWMTVGVPRGRARLKTPLTVEAEADLVMRDSRAVVALFAEVKKWLRHVQGMLTVKDIEGSANVVLASERFSLRDLTLTGNKLDALAELELGPGRNEGIFWFKYGILSLGLQRIDATTDWKLVDSRRWFEEERAAFWATGADPGSGPR